MINIFNSVLFGKQLISIIYLHLDVGVGRLKPQDLPPTYVQMGVKMFVERLRRGLCIHPEFSDQLSDFDKSLLWKKNFSLAGALSMVKVFLKKLFENRRDMAIRFLYLKFYQKFYL